jgi:hypothetical protein
VTRTKSPAKILSLTRQCVNWWLGYVLSQPVDIDLSVIMQFARNYVGLSYMLVIMNQSVSHALLKPLRKQSRSNP